MSKTYKQFITEITRNRFKKDELEIKDSINKENINFNSKGVTNLGTFHNAKFDHPIEVIHVQKSGWTPSTFYMFNHQGKNIGEASYQNDDMYKPEIDRVVVKKEFQGRNIMTDLHAHLKSKNIHPSVYSNTSVSVGGEKLIKKLNIPHSQIRNGLRYNVQKFFGKKDERD